MPFGSKEGFKFKLISPFMLSSLAVVKVDEFAFIIFSPLTLIPLGLAISRSALPPAISKFPLNKEGSFELT